MVMWGERQKKNSFNGPIQQEILSKEFLGADKSHRLGTVLFTIQQTDDDLASLRGATEPNISVRI